MIKMQKEKGDKSQANLFIPEIVQINYSEYSDVPIFENNIYAKPYKDGIITSRNTFQKYYCSFSGSINFFCKRFQIS